LESRALISAESRGFPTYQTPVQKVATFPLPTPVAWSKTFHFSVLTDFLPHIHMPNNCEEPGGSVAFINGSPPVSLDTPAEAAAKAAADVPEHK
jgi:hypothetical protein